MRLFRVIFSIILVFCILNETSGQVKNPFSNSFTENTSDTEKFGIYLDTINAYIFRDVSIAKLGLNECKKLLDIKTPVSDDQLFTYTSFRILYLNNMEDPLGAYEVILDFENKMEYLNLSEAEAMYIKISKSFSFLSLGDIEAAQTSYHEILQMARLANDTSSIELSLFSLAQLYNDQKEYKASIEYLEESMEYNPETAPDLMVLINLEFGLAYKGLGRNEEALRFLDEGYKIADKNGLEILKYECLIESGNIHIKNKDLIAAKKINNQLVKLGSTNSDQQLLTSVKIFQANLLRAQKEYPAALDILEKLVAQTDTIQQELLIDLYSEMHEINKDMQNYEAAYANLVTHNRIKKQKEKDTRKQKTKYLNIKFETEKKEKENSILTAEIIENQAKNRLLYMWLALSFSVLIVFISAFFYKNQYSKKLEAEVEKRTLNLKTSNELLHQSNQELKKFNHLLSHDLKEPIRSIVSFSQLANRPNLSSDELSDYMNYVAKSGQQLQNLINSINSFQHIDHMDFTTIEFVDLSYLFNKTIRNLNNTHPGKKINFINNTVVAIPVASAPLSLIITKILENAITYNLNETVEIQLEYYFEEERHHIKIKDNGIGIDTAYHEKIFDMLTRLNNREDYPGSGMGLSIAQKIIQRMNGHLSLVCSDNQQGSTFLITLPERELSVLEIIRSGQKEEIGSIL